MSPVILVFPQSYVISHHAMLQDGIFCQSWMASTFLLSSLCVKTTVKFLNPLGSLYGLLIGSLVRDCWNLITKTKTRAMHTQQQQSHTEGRREQHKDDRRRMC